MMEEADPKLSKYMDVRKNLAVKSVEGSSATGFSSGDGRLHPWR